MASVIDLGYRCAICRQRDRSVRSIPDTFGLFACLTCVPKEQEETAALEHRVKQLRVEKSRHYANYNMACAMLKQAEERLEQLRVGTAVAEGAS